MNTPHIASLLGLALLGGAASAQEVTLFGIADAAFRHVDNQGRGSVNSVVSGSNSTSRLGVRGREDLGGGLWAGFHLEHGLLLDTGTPASATQFFDRRSTVSIGDARWGEIRIGRDFVPSYNNWSRYDPYAYVGVGGANNFVSATPLGPIRSAFGSAPNTTVRSSNAVQWVLPSGWGGLEGELMWAAREGGTAANGQHGVKALRLGYAAGSWGVSAASTRTTNDLTTTGTFRDDALGGNADLGTVRLSAVLRRFSQNQARQTDLLIGARVPLGAGELKFSYHRADLSGRVGTVSIDGNDARQLAIGYVYNLSKRSALYATVARIDNHGAATFVVPGGPTGLAGGGSSTGTEFGVRHNF